MQTHIESQELGSATNSFADVSSPVVSIKALQENMLYTPKTKNESSSSRQSSYIYENVHIRDHLQMLIDGYKNSELCKEMKRQFSNNEHQENTLRRAFSLSNITNDSTRATWWSQFTILSGRAFKNLYRNPLLLQSHYIMSVVFAITCGFLFWQVTSDIPGFQNRMVYLFLCRVSFFSCARSLDSVV